MAAVLKLQRRSDSQNSLVDELSLYGYEDGIAVADWIPGAEVNGAQVTEAMTLYLKGTNVVHVNDMMVDLDDKIQEVKHYEEMSERYSVWLTNQADDEDDTRRAFISSMAGQPTGSYHDYVTRKNDFLRYTLTLTRAPFWEGANYREIDFLSCGPSGQIKMGTGVPPSTAIVPGTTQGRIGQVTITNPTVPVCNQIWMGLRSNQFGYPSAFDGDWDIGSNQHWTDADTSVSGSDVVCSFSADAAMADRVLVRLTDAVPSPADMRGEYQILMLAKVGADTVCHVQLKDGLHATVTGSGVSETWNTHQRTRVDQTSSYFYNMGTVRIPPSRGESSSSFMSNYALLLAAQRTSGSGSLTMEKLVLIPRSEGYLHIKNTLLTGANAGSSINVYHRPEDTLDGYYMYASGEPSYEALLDPYNWSFPLGYGYGEHGQARLVVAAETSSGFNSSLRLNVRLRVWPRYRTMVG